MNVFPILGWGNFGSSQRYSLHLLPALALLGARALDPWWQHHRPHLATVAATLLLAIWVATRQAGDVTPSLVIGFYVVLLAAAWLRAGTVACAVAAGLAVLGLLLPMRVDVPRSITAPYLSPMVAWLAANPELSRGRIYTNGQLLAPFLEGRRATDNIFHIPGIDMIRELMNLTNSANGQRERIAHLCAVDLYGKTLLAHLTPEAVPPDTVFLLRKDPRLPLLLPDEVWASHVDVLADEPMIRVIRPRLPAQASSLRGSS